MKIWVNTINGTKRNANSARVRLLPVVAHMEIIISIKGIRTNTRNPMGLLIF